MTCLVFIAISLYDVSYAVGRVLRLGWPAVVIVLAVLLMYVILKRYLRRKWLSDREHRSTAPWSTMAYVLIHLKSPVMSLEEKRRLILSLDQLIRGGVPGNAEYLAARLGISRSTFFRLIEYMRVELCAPLFFDTRRNRYAYEFEGRIVFRFLPYEMIDVKQARKILGGSIKR
jgi:hypothetical protein